MSTKMSLMPISLGDLGPGLHAMLKVAINNRTPIAHEIRERAMRDVMCESFDRLAKICPRGASLWQPHPRRFAITVPGMGELDAHDLANRARAILTQSPIATLAGPVEITSSIGAVTARNTTLEALATSARGALIEAMSSGSALRMAQSDREHDFQRAQAISMAQSALVALGGGQVSVSFQPVIRASGPQVAAFHQCQARGDARDQISYLTSPAVSQLLDRYALAHALDALGEDPLARLAVPVQRSAYSDQEWMHLLLSAIQRTEDVAERLIIEVSEKSVDEQELPGFLNNLRNRGACISLTDFGARRVPMSQLSGFNFDMARLAPALTTQISQRSDIQLLVDSLIAKSSRIDMPVIGAGIDRPEDAQILAKLGVDYLQGDLFGEESAVLSPRTLVNQDLRFIA